MELDEILVRKQHLQHLESLESGSGTPSKPSYLLMDRDEMIRYIEFLQTRLDEEKRARELSDKRFEEESEARREADKRVFELLDQISRMGEQHSREMQSLLQKNQELQHSIEDLTSALHITPSSAHARCWAYRHRNILVCFSVLL